MTDLEAVVFDLDCTLCVSEQSGEDIHEAVFERADVEEFFDPSDVYAVDSSTFPEAESDREHYENLYRAVAERVAGDPSQAPELAEATVDVIDPTAVSWREGARDALERARERYAVGLVTSGSKRRQTAKLETLGVADAFDATVICGPGTDVPSKPDREPFLRALSNLDAPPERTLSVGDWYEGDVAPAADLGMRTAWVPMRADPDDRDPEPTHILDSMADLPDVLGE